MRLVNILLGSCLLCVPPAINAGVPQQISFQGILNDTSGTAVDDDVYAIKFAICDDSTAGSILWETAGFVPIQTHEGLFQHVLGSTNPIPDSIAKCDGLWVGITVNLEPEMIPRTRLTSVPFAFMAHYADTATASLDRTIDAGELKIGMLDTARFSAYDDLISENKVGTEEGRVAPGIHNHTIFHVPGSFERIEDTTTLMLEILAGQTTMLKTITIPGGTINDYFSLRMALDWPDLPQGNLWLETRANGVQIFFYVIGYSVSIELLTLYCVRLIDSDWVIRNATCYSCSPVRRAINTEQDIILEIYITSPGDLLPITVGNLIIEYDVD